MRRTLRARPTHQSAAAALRWRSRHRRFRGDAMLARSTICGLMLAALAPLVCTAQPAGDYHPVTDARLESPEARNWLMYRRNYDSWGYSPLTAINARNVGNLAPVWTLSTGANEGHQAPPIVNDGIMFVTTPFNQIIAVDAKTGDLLWRYRSSCPPTSSGHPTNRGVALYGDKVYMATSDARRRRAATRTPARWFGTRPSRTTTSGYYMTLAPLAARGKIMVGVSGGERGIRGFVVALDAETGEEVVEGFHGPSPGEPGNDTWPGESWRTGGASGLDHRQLRSEAQSHVLGHGQPGTLDRRSTPRRQPLHELGRRARRRHRQARGLSPVSLERFVGLGRSIRAAARSTCRATAACSRDSCIRAATAISGCSSAPPTRSSSSARSRTSRKTCSRASIRKPGGPNTTWSKSPAPAGRHVLPSLWGGKDWPPAAYSPRTGFLYIPANENLCQWLQGEEVRVSARPAIHGRAGDFSVARQAPITSASYRPGT